ncbi:MAG: Hsp33 family molecular chaperone HslO [Spirochaetia bacterium]|nr:Hsp33 family molecular chaperone HslO [Spirochaetia bacterium]
MAFVTDLLNEKHNFSCRGILPDLRYRFLLARNSAAAAEIGRLHNASAKVAALMGETMMGSYFLSSHASKQQKITVSLHLECKGPLHRLIGTANNEGGIRCMASRPEADWDGDLYSGKGKGLLTVNRWRDDVTKVYSSTVEMREAPLYKNLEEYIGKSEQIQSFIKMESIYNDLDSLKVSGYFFQAMPDASFEDTETVVNLLAEQSPDRMLDQFLQIDQNVRTNFKSNPIFHNIKILGSGKFFHHCGCSRKKIESMLHALGREAAEESLLNYGQIEIQCEFCKKFYYFTEKDMASIFEGE